MIMEPAADTEISSESNAQTLTDAGKYAFAGLAANILAELYKDVEESGFRHQLLDDLMKTIDLPESSRQAQLAVADGEYKTKPEPFIDLLLQEGLVKESPESLLTSLLLVAIKDGVYDARVRIVVEHMSWLLRVDMKSVEVVEEHLLEILKNHEELSDDEKAHARKKSRNKKIKRGFLIGLATVVGGTVIGLTGGLAAPLIATGVGAVIGTAGGAALGSVAGVAVIGSLFGVAGAGLTGYKMKKRVGGVEQFEFDTLSDGSQMAVTIAVSGWVSRKGNEDFRTPWLSLDNSKEQYYLKYEGHYLQELGQSLETLSSMVVRQAIAESLKYTVLSTLMAAIAWPSALLGLASIIDNPWHVCTKRAENAGKQLAEVLISRLQGHRPVTLIGFSLGARVIFYCLKELCKHPKGVGIVENAYLLGAPVSGAPAEWQPFSKVVAGRIVNAYIRNDWMLKFLYRTASVQFRIAGISPVQWDNRRMINMDLTNIVNGHMDYMKKMATVLEAVGIKTKEVHNVFASTSDSGYTSALSTSTSQDCELLLPKKLEEESLETAEEPPILAFGDNAESLAPNPDLSQPPYEKLKLEDSQNSLDSEPQVEKAVPKAIDQGETTDSDKSLADKCFYEQLINKGSSEDEAIFSPDKPKQKLVKVVPVGKVVGSERLLGDLSTRDRLLTTDSSNDSIASECAKKLTVSDGGMDSTLHAHVPQSNPVDTKTEAETAEDKDA